MKFNHNQITWINDNVNMQDLLEQMGCEIPSNGQIFCPFHENKVTKAAKFYFDSNSMYCFFEKRRYGAFSALRKLGISEEDIFRKLPDDLRMNKATLEEDYVVEFPVIADIKEEYIKLNDLKQYLEKLDYYYQIKSKILLEKI